MISIIIPVYNSQDYLEKCLDSVLNQSFKDIEVICVDDGSIDASLSIMREYERKDNRICVIKKEHAGLVSARKTGVAASNGQYVSFVDADDWIASEMYEKLYNYVMRYDCDMVCSGLYRQIGENSVLNINTIEPGYYDNQGLIDRVYPYMLYDGRFFRMGVRPNLVGKLIKTEMVIKLQKHAPEDVTNGEDVMLTYPCLLNSNKVYLTDEAWYYYRQHPQSMSQKNATKKETLSTRHLYRFLKSCFENYPYQQVLIKQLMYFMAHFQIQREPAIFDDCYGELRMFGGVNNSDRIVVYGAGRFGKQIYNYLIKSGNTPIWVDKQAETYRVQGLPVENVAILNEMEYDKIIIAVIDAQMTVDIKRALIQNGIQERKVKILDIDYITSDYIMSKMGFI